MSYDSSNRDYSYKRSIRGNPPPPKILPEGLSKDNSLPFKRELEEIWKKGEDFSGEEKVGNFMVTLKIYNSGLTGMATTLTVSNMATKPKVEFYAIYRFSEWGDIGSSNRSSDTITWDEVLIPIRRL